MKPHLIDKDTEVKSLAQITQNKQVAEPRLESRGSSLQCDEGEVQCVRVRKKKQGVCFRLVWQFFTPAAQQNHLGNKTIPKAQAQPDQLRSGSGSG